MTHSAVGNILISVVVYPKGKLVPLLAAQEAYLQALAATTFDRNLKKGI